MQSASFKQALESKKFILTCELAPPKGTEIQKFLALAKTIENKADAVNITDGQGASVRMSSIIASFLIKNNIKNLDVICQLVCRDRNSIGLQADILGALGLNINNYLILNGDKSSSGDNPQARDVFELSTDSLLDIFKAFQAGKDYAGNSLENKNISEICLGVAGHPGFTSDSELQAQAEKIKTRIQEKNICFIQTQIVYELDQAKKFLDSIVKNKINIPVLFGITPLKSSRMANFINQKVYGVNIPEDIINRLEKAENQEQEGLNICFEFLGKLKKLNINGVHLMPIGQEDKTSYILEKIKEIFI